MKKENHYSQRKQNFSENALFTIIYNFKFDVEENSDLIGQIG